MGEHWMDRAACKGADPGMWFPPKPGPVARERQERVEAAGGDVEANLGVEAKTVCAQCPVLRECLEGAIERREEHGIWGGAGENWRRQLARAYRAGPDAWERALAAHAARLDQLTASDEAVEPTARAVVDTNGPGATHGLASTYARGCRCEPCRLAVVDRSDKPTPTQGDRSPAALLADQDRFIDEPHTRRTA